jgi:phosphate ABC transporter phosphate-binding protein
VVEDEATLTNPRRMVVSARSYRGRRFLLFLALGSLALGFCSSAYAQGVSSLSDVKTLYVDSFPGGSDADLLHDNLVHRLTTNHRFRIVPSPKDADAVVKGTGQIWVRGYITTNSRSPGSNREPVYGGYFSLEVVAANGEPIWSWLVTPSRLAWSGIVDDLAGHAIKKLLDAAEPSSAPSAAPAVAGKLAQTTLTGAGATFPAPLYQKWFEDFEQIHTGVLIRYNAVGSQSGIEQLVADKLDFAGSDVAPEAISNDAAAARLRRIASVLGAVVPIYNLHGVTQDLRFTPEALADIYLGRIHRWNDPEIRRSNSGVDLPDAEITVIHRSDGSGTTWVWSNFLSKVSHAWLSSVGRGTVLHWPVGIGAEHNEGVADAVQKTPNSIGYVELAYAIQLEISFAAVRNSAGEYIHADLDSLTEAAKGSDLVAPDITNAPGKYSYPIAAFTWLVIPAEMTDPTKKAALLELLSWILTFGQRECSSLGYAPLPREISDSQLRVVNGLR